jgi:hypothetical protein
MANQFIFEVNSLVIFFNLPSLSSVFLPANEDRIESCSKTAKKTVNTNDMSSLQEI